MRTVSWNPDGPSVEMIDQRLLPAEVQTLQLRSPEQVSDAIRDMAVRGAPAIGATAAYGLALAAHQADGDSSQVIWEQVLAKAERLRAARPTAVNLGWALDRMLAYGQEHLQDPPDAFRQRMLELVERIADQDVEINKRMGEFGSELIADGDTVIHHCNTGALATVDYGTALGVIRSAHEGGKRVHVLVDETRPRLQGARLTAWELEQYGIDYDIIADNAAGSFLQSGAVAAAFVGADRVAANGDVANKIGTYMLALAARDNRVPFYAVVPTSTIDLTLPSGDLIPIEERDPAEVLNIERDGVRLSPRTGRARNPAFDITPHDLVTAIVTEVGIIHPPYETGLAKAVEVGRSLWTSS